MKDVGKDFMRHSGNAESRDAHESIKESKATVRRAIFAFAKARGDYGITADEVAAEWGVTHNHVAPRITELKIQSRLVPTDKKRLTRAWRWARVLVATDVKEPIEDEVEEIDPLS